MSQAHEKERVCKVCDVQPASHEGVHPDWCAGCDAEFKRYEELKHSVCDACLTPLSCRVLKRCPKIEVLNEIANALV